LFSPELSVVSRRRGPNVGSDHLPLVIEIRVPDRSSVPAPGGIHL
jgi:endonuclease/exonuclease/phosphatase (EEP) superfamily protein YafD